MDVPVDIAEILPALRARLELCPPGEVADRLQWILLEAEVWLLQATETQGVEIDPASRATFCHNAALAALVTHYREHAEFEEQNFLPLSKTILGRNGDHMAALGVSLHIGRAMPGVLGRYGHRI